MFHRNPHGALLLEMDGQIENDGKDNCTPQDVAILWEGKRNPNQLKFTVDLSEGGWLMVSETWYPGWVATVDGTKTDIKRANYLFRAIYIPSGEHEIEMVYKPRWFYFGLALSMLSGMIFTLFVFLRIKRWPK